MILKLNLNFCALLILFLMSCQIDVVDMHSMRNFKTNVKSSFYVRLNKFLRENYKEFSNRILIPQKALKKSKLIIPVKMTHTSKIEF